MKIIFSPSKGMKYREIRNITGSEEPLFIHKTDKLLKILKNFSKEDVSRIMKLKGNLLDKTYKDFQNFNDLIEYRAIELYSGASYSNLDTSSYDLESLEYMQEKLKILSALYGILTPKTLIKEYRLDMTIKILENSSLYSYWKDSIEKYFVTEEIIINLASGEFSKLLNKNIYSIVDIEFRQVDGVEIKNISTEAKKMRGKLLNYMVKNKIDSIEAIKSFSENNYSYSEIFSNDKKLFFIK
ncbi:MAG: YaaA family protein [Fusobacteriaceae bacterium]